MSWEMMMEKKLSEFGKYSGIISYGLLLVLLSQYVISLSSDTVVVSMETIFGLMCLLIISLIGILVAQVLNTKFPVLGWVSITSLVMCLEFWPWSEFFINSINAVNFLSLTTPILAFAGFSIADQLVDLGKISYKIVVVGVFVFIGTFLFSAIIAQALLVLQ